MYSEFVERTGMNVNSAEFDAIIEVYNNSDVNKDDFCKLWVKMNFNRVATYKAKKAKEEKQHKVWGDLHEVLSKYQNKLDNSRNWYQSYVSPIGAVLSSSDEKKVIAFCQQYLDDKNYRMSIQLKQDMQNFAVYNQYASNNLTLYGDADTVYNFNPSEYDY